MDLALVPNHAGCGALINMDAMDTGCGKALADAIGCLDFTCLEQCPNDYAACEQESGTSECKTFQTAAKTACPVDVKECFVRATDKSPNDVRKRVIERFCGSF